MTINIDQSSLIERLDQACAIFAIDQPLASKENSILYKAARALEAQTTYLRILNSDHAEFTCPNGDKLTLDRDLCHLYGKPPAVVWSLTYGERVEGNYGEDEPTPGVYHFMATSTEYFASHHGMVAIQAFNQRVNSDRPGAHSGLGRPLSELLST